LDDWEDREGRIAYLGKLKDAARDIGRETTTDPDDLDALLDTEPSRAALVRRLNAKSCRELVAWILRMFPEALVESSDRGVHVLIFLDDEYEPEELGEVTKLLEDLLYERTDLSPECAREVFPKLNGRCRLDYCRAPLTGRHRFLADDLETPRFTRREYDFEALQKSFRPSLRLIREVIARELTALSSRNQRATHSMNWARVKEAVGSVADDETSHRREAVTPVGEAAISKRCRSTSGRLLKGHAFTKLVEEYVEHIPDDCSFDAAHKLAWSFALNKKLYSESESLSGFLSIIEKPGHAATHCQTEQGRRELGRTFLCLFRRYRRDCPAKIVNPRLCRVVERAMGLPLTLLCDPVVRLRLPRERIDAATRRWVESFFEPGWAA
jgi:hypothetical protein